eukprot:365490-Chlamydomonas_euryale.AAC.10
MWHCKPQHDVTLRAPTLAAPQRDSNTDCSQHSLAAHAQWPIPKAMHNALRCMCGHAQWPIPKAIHNALRCMCGHAQWPIPKAPGQQAGTGSPHARRT